MGATVVKKHIIILLPA